MESIAQFFVASAELVEAEGRALKRTIGRMTLALGVAIVALAMVLVGTAFVVYALLAFLANAIGWPAAALVFGVIAFAAAGAAGLTVKRLFR